MARGYFGIDFGTTNTAVVFLLTDELGSKLILCSDADTNTPFPSLLAINKRNGDILFGHDVKNRREQLAEEYHIFRSFKSLLGTDAATVILDKRYTPVDVTMLFLEKIKQYIKDNHDFELEEAVFAIPVDFNSRKRKELKRAAELAGIKVKQFVSEPTAAYIESFEEIKNYNKVAVFDWGGGTLDISLLALEDTTLRELAKGGVKRGGDDVDEELARTVHAGFVAEKAAEGIPIMGFVEIPAADKDQLLKAAEWAKMDLSEMDEAEIQLLDYLGVRSYYQLLEIERFKDLIQPYITTAIARLEETIKKGGLSLGGLDAIIMAGGSSAMRPIQEEVNSLFDGKKVEVYYPEPERMRWAAAVGAAKIAALGTRHKLDSSISLELANGELYDVFKKGTNIPCQADEAYFGVVEDATVANFIFKNDKLQTLRRVGVPIKGFTQEGISLKGEVDTDLIARLMVKSTHMGEQFTKSVEIHELDFSYDLTKLFPELEKMIQKSEGNPISPRKRKKCRIPECEELAKREGFCSFHYRQEKAESK